MAYTTRRKASKATDILIVGAHPFGDKRVKIQAAKKLAVQIMPEAAFRNKFGV